MTSDWRSPDELAELYMPAEPAAARVLFEAVKAGIVRARHSSGIDIPREAISGVLWHYQTASGHPDGALPPDLLVSAGDAATRFENAVLRNQPKRRRGRPAGAGHFVHIDTILLNEMHKLVLLGVSVRRAAREMAPQARGGNTQPDSAEERLRKKYRSKYGSN